MEAHELETGEDPGSPSKPTLLLKLSVTAVITNVFFALSTPYSNPTGSVFAKRPYNTTNIFADAGMQTRMVPPNGNKNKQA